MKDFLVGTAFVSAITLPVAYILCWTGLILPLVAFCIVIHMAMLLGACGELLEGPKSQ